MTEITQEEAWRELAPLRKAVAQEFARPLMPSQPGLDDLVDRVTVAVARYMAKTVPATAEQHRRMADALDRLDGTDRVFPGNTAPCRDFANDHHGHGWDQGAVQYWCPGVDRISTGTVYGIRPHRPDTPAEDIKRRRAAELWTEGLGPITPEKADRMIGVPTPTDVMREEWDAHLEEKGLVPPAGCSDCGALPTETVRGRATLHTAACQYSGTRGPQA